MATVNFEILEGDSDSTVILHVPHASRAIPVAVRADLLLDEPALNRELDAMTDTDTDLLAIAACNQAKVKPWIFQNKLSRLVIDPERFPDDREVMNSIGMGAVYRKTSKGEDLRKFDGARDAALLQSYFHPYAAALEETVRRIAITKGCVTIIDVHSYPRFEHLNGVNKGQQRPAVCLGVDDFHTPAWLLNLAQSHFSRLGEVIINEPYAGTYVPLSLYQVDSRVSSVMMENREDTIVGAGLSRSATVLADLIDAIEESR